MDKKEYDALVSKDLLNGPTESYDDWFRRKVQESLDDPRPTVPHEQVMRDIKRKSRIRKNGSV